VGKSTLGAVLARLLDPVAGTVTVGGRDVRTMPEAAVRGRIVLVGDDTGHVFASTVRENLRLARPAAGDEELRAVLARVRLDEWLAGLPDGLDTWLGTGGRTMSGGQARRLATARALLAEPDLLILDEPTEGLDEHTARALMDDLLDAAGGRTVLVLTHRTEGLHRTDRVLTLRDGRLTAESPAGSR
jgi:ATP-binding cassette subfamily C protein CydCD